METTVNQRLNLIVDTFEKGKKAAFARKAGISPQGVQEILAGRKGDPSFKVLVKILESYPQIRMEWLVMGQGPMLKEENAEKSTVHKMAPDEIELLSRQVINAQPLNRQSGGQSAITLLARIQYLKSEEYSLRSLLSSLNEVEQSKSGESSTSGDARKAHLQVANDQLYTKQAELMIAQALEAQTRREAQITVYRLDGAEDFTKPFSGLLTHRLSISKELAHQLILAGKIRATGSNAEGYQITEQAVREFLGEPSI